MNMFQQQNPGYQRAKCLSVTKDCKKPVDSKFCLTILSYNKMVCTFQTGKGCGEYKLGARQPVTDTSERHVMAWLWGIFWLGLMMDMY
jgi:hypothetical protein